VLRCSGMSAAALDVIARLQTLPAFPVRLGGLSVICDGEQSRAVAEAVLDRAAAWCKAPISVLQPDDFTSWKERYGEGPLSRTLILFIEEDAELQYLDLRSLLQDFLEISEVSLLAPA